RPFHAGYGNDTGQPNLGDYIQAVALNGTLHSLAAATSVSPRFDEGQPASSGLITPDSYYDRLSDATTVAPVRLSDISCIRVDPPVGGPITETLELRIPLTNYVANPNNSPATLTNVSAALTTTLAGVSILAATQPYANIAPLATQTNAAPFKIELAPTITPGLYIPFALNVTTDQGAIQLLYRLRTGSPGTATMLISENFDGVSAPNLPSGWSSAHGDDATTIPWVVTDAFTVNGTNAAYHENRTGVTRFERLYSPVITVTTPAAGVESYVTLDFDILYKLESEPLRAILAYDGLTLRITDWTTGETFRLVLAEAFAENITTGAIRHFPKHTPRNNSAAYFQDMSVWSGDSGGAQHVSMRFPGAGMTGRPIQLRFEYTENSSGDCSDSGSSAPCGVALDNIVLRHVEATAGTCVLRRVYLPVLMRSQ
ncbi:MAG: Big 3 5 protein, partial [Chloroflexota bacterium]|nr:Big 3 5 protein [Chloroflexota bacterium]